MNGTPQDTASPRTAPTRQHGPALRALREKDGLSQADLARAAGLSQADLSRFETESANARVATINRLARALGVGAAAIMREIPEPAPVAPQQPKAVA
jgi:transcriptional regulator with XRE-family HTH domain